MPHDVTIYQNTSELNRWVRVYSAFGRAREITPAGIGIQNTYHAEKVAYVLAEAARLAIDVNDITVAGVQLGHTARGGVTVQPIIIHEMRLRH